MNELTVSGLVPANLSEAMQLAEMMSAAKLVPTGLQKSPADCLMVIQQAIRWQMDPFAVAQEVAIIQGKLMYSGKVVAAAVNTRANLTGRLRYDYKGSGDERIVVVSGHLEGEDEPRTVEVCLKKVRTSNVQWDKQTDQQLAYHAVRVWARRHVPEIMLGVKSPEEFDAEPRQRPQYAPNVMTQNLPRIEHDPHTGEVDDYADQIEHVIETTNGNGGSKEIETVTASDDAREEGIAEKVALCGSVKALSNYFRTLSADEQEQFRDMFSARRAELEE